MADPRRPSFGDHTTPISLEELAPRVREVERLAALGCRLARDAALHPEQTAHTHARIQSILEEVGTLVPGFGADLPVNPAQFIPPSAAARAAAAPPEEAAPQAEEESDEDSEGEVDPSAVDEEDDDEGDEDEEAEEEEPEWELDPEKLAAALSNEALMAQIPEVDREWFKELARRAIDSHARAVFATRVKDALSELHAAVERCHEETSRKLGLALTFEQLRLEQAQKKPD